MKWLLGLLVAVHIVAGLRVVAATDWEQPSFVAGDHLQYRRLVETDGRPYRDKTVAFPPLSYAAFVAVERPVGPAAGGRLLALSQLACDLVVAAALAFGWGRRASAAWLVLMAPMLWDGWVLGRIDLLSVALALSGLALVRRRRATGGGLVLAAAILAKIWPVAVVPGLAVEGERRALRAAVATLSVAGTAWLVLGGPGGIRDVVFFGGSRRWQAESTVGAVWYLVAGGPLVSEEGAWRIGSEPMWAGLALGLATVAAIVAAWAWSGPERADPARLAAVGALVVLAPVLSPQYLVWLLPFAAVLASDAVVAVLAGAASVLTALVAHSYDDFVAGSPWWQWAVVARNAALVALVGVAFAGLARPVRAGRRAPARHAVPPSPSSGSRART